MADPKPTHTYVGNPGYEFPIGGQLVVLHPGDEVTLTFDEADGFGDDFDPKPAFVKAKAERDAKADADAAKNTEPATADETPPSGDDKGA